MNLIVNLIWIKQAKCKIDDFKIDVVTNKQSVREKERDTESEWARKKAQ